MTAQRRAINAIFVKIGDPVRSKQVGSKAAFNGEISQITASSATIRDAENKHWVREWRELESIS